MSELSILNNYIPQITKWYPIVFISDLHFDFTMKKFRAKAPPMIKDNFITYIKEQFTDSILCLAGDYFDDYEETLQFIKELEQNRIVGFFVLGNHDFWNNGTKSHKDIISLFNEETQGNQYFRFLFSGRKYYVDDICFIGDTGWTSFKRGKRRVSLKQFIGLPDAFKVKDFHLKNIISMHDEWVSFANNVLVQEKKVVILTHFPMVDFTQEDKDCWGSSQTKVNGENSWRIFGHTHKFKERQNNNVSSQRGYDNRDSEDLEYIGRQYSPEDFGILEKVIEHRFPVNTKNYQIVSKYYSPLVVSNAKIESGFVSAIKRRGYKRCSANKLNFAVLANDPETYLLRVKQMTIGYLGNTYIGYYLVNQVSKDIIESVFSSIRVLENVDYNDIRAFITAAVITGYVFNRMIFFLEGMRPLDDYDIIRFWLMFLTMKRYKIGIDSIDTIRTNRKYHTEFCNVNIYLPVINGLSLSIDEVQMKIQQTPLLPRPVALSNQENLDDRNFVQKKNSQARYTFTFVYMSVPYGVYSIYKERLFYVSADVDKTCGIIYKLTLADDSPNILLLKKKKHKTLFDKFIDEYRWGHGHVRFESVEIRDIVIEVDKYTLLYK